MACISMVTSEEGIKIDKSVGEKMVKHGKK